MPSKWQARANTVLPAVKPTYLLMVKHKEDGCSAEHFCCSAAASALFQDLLDAEAFRYRFRDNAANACKLFSLSLYCARRNIRSQLALYSIDKVRYDTSTGVSATRMPCDC